MVAKVRKPRISRDMDKDQSKKKTSSNSKEKAPDAVASQLGQTVDPLAPKTKALDIRTFLLFLFVYFHCCCFVVVDFFCFFFGRGMYHTFFMINESIFLLFSISSLYTLWDSLL